MLYCVKLKNVEDYVLFDSDVYEYLVFDLYLVKINFIDNFCRYLSGCVVFQKIWCKVFGKYKMEMIYLYKFIVEKFLVYLKLDKKNLVGVKNGNKLDCCLGNLIYCLRVVVSCKCKIFSWVGYIGVYQENN